MDSPQTQELLNDHEMHVKRVGKDFAEMRKPHLLELQKLQNLAKELSPLPISYDVTKIQPPYFNEFTCTELLGCLIISPQSSEVSARITEQYESKSYYFPVHEYILNRKDQNKTLDKYKLDTKLKYKDLNTVIFLPGTNLLKSAVSKEKVTEILFEDETALLKPHPMTNPDTIRMLGREYGYHRIIEPLYSGWLCLQEAKNIYVTTTTEMGLYATLLEKPINNIGNVFTNGKGAYNSIYRLLWNKSPKEAKDILIKCLASPYSGVIHPNDPYATKKMTDYFNLAMKIREDMRPRVFEIGPTEWADIQLNKINGPKEDNVIR